MWPECKEPVNLRSEAAAAAAAAIGQSQSVSQLSKQAGAAE